MRRGTARLGNRRFAISAATTAIALALCSGAHAAEPAPSRNEAAGPAATGERAAGEKRGGSRTDHFRIGALVGVGFPRPFAIEGFAKVEKLVGVGFEYSFLPRVHVGNVDASFSAVAADLRVFPFKGAFFIGARGGRQWLDARAAFSAGSLGSIMETMEASTWFVNPRAGFLHTFESGITVGIDAGVQLPVGSTYDRAGRATAAGFTTQTVDGTLVAVANALGNKTTPTIDLLKLGFLF